MFMLLRHVRFALFLPVILFVALFTSPVAAFQSVPVSSQDSHSHVFLPTSDHFWSLLNFGIDPDGLVSAVAANSAELYVGGIFWNACGNTACDSGNTPVSYIAKWDGAAWSSLGYGLDGNVFAIAVDGSDVYVGGVFTNACGNAGCSSGNIPVNHVAKWNGTNWSAVGNGFDSAVLALATKGNEIFAGGVFTNVCGNTTCDTGNQSANRMARWTGSSWVSMDNGVDNNVLTIGVKGTDVYFGGGFQVLCGVDCSSNNTKAYGITKWDGNHLNPIAIGLNGAVHAIVADSTDIYIGGSFNAICGDASCVTASTTANHIVKWNGSSYELVGNGLGPQISALAFDGTKLYAGGDFTAVCGNTDCNSGNTVVNRIAVWDGTTWAAVEYGMDNNVAALASHSGKIFAGGNFQRICGNTACNSGNSTVNHVTEYKVCTATAPAKPILQSPKNNSITAKTRPTLKWSAICADTFNVTVRNAVTNAKVDAAKNLTRPQFKTKTLLTGNTYKWFVQACNSFGCTKSATWKFSEK